MHDRHLALAQKISDRSVLAEAWQILSYLAEKEGDFKNAHSYYINYVNARDSIRNRENIYKIANLQTSFETEKKQAEIESLKKEHRQQAFRRNAIAAGLDRITDHRSTSREPATTKDQAKQPADQYQRRVDPAVETIGRADTKAKRA